MKIYPCPCGKTPEIDYEDPDRTYSISCDQGTVVCCDGVAGDEEDEAIDVWNHGVLGGGDLDLALSRLIRYGLPRLHLVRDRDTGEKDWQVHTEPENWGVMAYGELSNTPLEAAQSCLRAVLEAQDD